MTDKATINNWDGASTLQTWTAADGKQMLLARDVAGFSVLIGLRDWEACRLAFAVSPEPSKIQERARAYMQAVYELNYPEARASMLREVADEIGCDGGCEGCTPGAIERGDFCKYVAAEDLRNLATALDLKVEADKAGALSGAMVAAARGLVPPAELDTRGRIMAAIAADPAFGEIASRGDRERLADAIIARLAT